MQFATSKNLTALGVSAILAAAASAVYAVFDGDPATVPNFQELILAIIGLVGVMAKGQSNTGGTVPVTPEAAKRVQGGYARLATLLTVVAVLVGVLFAAPARAGWGTTCLSDACRAKESASVRQFRGPALPDLQVGPTVWLGPSVGVLFVRDGSSKSWASNVQPMLSYGLKYAPHGWTATNSLIAIDLAVSAGFTSTATPASIDLMLPITLLNTISVGPGVRFHLSSSPSDRDAASFLLAIGLGPAIGGP